MRSFLVSWKTRSAITHSHDAGGWDLIFRYNLISVIFLLNYNWHCVIAVNDLVVVEIKFKSAKKGKGDTTFSLN